jgi:hypothetical protein
MPCYRERCVCCTVPEMGHGSTTLAAMDVCALCRLCVQTMSLFSRSWCRGLAVALPCSTTLLAVAGTRLSPALSPCCPHTVASLLTMNACMRTIASATCALIASAPSLIFSVFCVVCFVSSVRAMLRRKFGKANIDDAASCSFTILSPCCIAWTKLLLHTA